VRMIGPVTFDTSTFDTSAWRCLPIQYKNARSFSMHRGRTLLVALALCRVAITQAGADGSVKSTEVLGEVRR